MILNQLPDRMVIKPQWLPLALYQEAIVSFSHYPAAKRWQVDAECLAEDVTYQASASFKVLSDCVFHTLLQGKPVTKALLREAFVNYIDTIIYEVEPFLLKEDPVVYKAVQPEPIPVENEPIIDFEVEQLSLLEATEDALDNERIFTSLNSQYLLMRDTVSSSKKFNEKEDGVYVSDMIDAKGELRGTAELRKDTIALPEQDQEKLWLSLVESTINAFDELTADLLDIISHMWVLQQKDEDGYIDFHSDEVLKLRHDNLDNKPLVIRERDRFKVMKRVAALSSIWISMRENDVKVVNKDKIKDDEEYDFTTFHRMFDINSVKVAYDKKTGEPKGIYELKIKPAPILRTYFDTSLQTFIPLDLKIIQYSYHTQRELKRLGRYLSYQWKVRTLSRNLKQPFKVRTLVETLDFPASYNGVIVRDKLEQTLDMLTKDGIIAEWYYQEPVDESRVGKRDWVKKYWGELNLIILPPQDTIEDNRKKYGQMAALLEKERAKQQLLNAAVDLAPSIVEPNPLQDVPLSPESVAELIDQHKLSIRAAAAEIGMSHSTLLRYLNNEAKRPNKASMKKLQNWYDERKNM